jgi:hypothetical protein
MVDTMILLLVATINTLAVIYALWLFRQALDTDDKNSFPALFPAGKPKKISAAQKELKDKAAQNAVNKLFNSELIDEDM